MLLKKEVVQHMCFNMSFSEKILRFLNRFGRHFGHMFIQTFKK